MIMGRWKNCIVCFDRVYSFDDDKDLKQYVETGNYDDCICFSCMDRLWASMTKKVTTDA